MFNQEFKVYYTSYLFIVRWWNLSDNQLIISLQAAATAAVSGVAVLDCAVLLLTVTGCDGLSGEAPKCRCFNCGGGGL